MYLLKLSIFQFNFSRGLFSMYYKLIGLINMKVLLSYQLRDHTWRFMNFFYFLLLSSYLNKASLFCTGWINKTKLNLNKTGDHNGTFSPRRLLTVSSVCVTVPRLNRAYTNFSFSDNFCPSVKLAGLFPIFPLHSWLVIDH